MSNLPFTKIVNFIHFSDGIASSNDFSLWISSPFLRIHFFYRFLSNSFPISRLDVPHDRFILPLLFFLSFYPHSLVLLYLVLTTVLAFSLVILPTEEKFYFPTLDT
jgi:hypothetical protein